VIGSVALTAYMVKDKDNASDVPLENFAALMPIETVTVARRYARIEQLPPKTVSGSYHGNQNNRGPRMFGRPVPSETLPAGTAHCLRVDLAPLTLIIPAI
jgi:hypothetical protein